MSDGAAYEPDEDDVKAHRYDPPYGDVYFDVNIRYGTGDPHYFVAMDMNGGEGSWWLDPDQAEILGRRLLACGIESSMRNQDQEARRLRLEAERRLDQPPSAG